VNKEVYRTAQELLSISNYIQPNVAQIELWFCLY